jgi:hypothetical protein
LPPSDAILVSHAIHKGGVTEVKPAIPRKLVLDEVVSPKDFDEPTNRRESTYRVNHEQTTIEAIAFKPDGTVQTPQGELAGCRPPTPSRFLTRFIRE